MAESKRTAPRTGLAGAGDPPPRRRPDAHVAQVGAKETRVTELRVPEAMAPELSVPETRAGEATGEARPDPLFVGGAGDAFRSSAIPVPPRPGRDLATWGGLAAGLALLFGAMLPGGAIVAYADFPAFLIVIGGTAAVTLVSFSLAEARRLPATLRTALDRGLPAADAVARRLIALADQARRSGAFSLEQRLPELRDDPFLVKAMAAIVDHTPPETLERQLRLELQAMLQRHAQAAQMLRRAGEVAPAMGLIGTLVGLVQMLAHLDTPARIGPAMAVAILATLYGAVLANMVLLPLAHKLERNSRHEALLHSLAILAAGSIAREESPLRTEMLLNGILAPAERIACFD